MEMRDGEVAVGGDGICWFVCIVDRSLPSRRITCIKVQNSLRSVSSRCCMHQVYFSSTVT